MPPFDTFLFIIFSFLLSADFWFLSWSFWWFDISLAFSVLVNHLNMSLWTFLHLNKMVFIFISFLSAFEDGHGRKLWSNKWIEFESFYNMIESSLHLTHTRARARLGFQCIYLSIELVSYASYFSFRFSVKFHMPSHPIHGWHCMPPLCPCACARARFFVNLTVLKRLLSIHRESIAHN